MSLSNIPQIQFSGTGATIPTKQALLTGACIDYQVCFNNQLNLNPNVSSTLSTPQGQLASTQAALNNYINSNFLFVLAQQNPSTCSGIWQDGMGKFFYDMVRLPALPTIVQVQCSGAIRLTIPIGAQVQDINGNTYSCTQGGIISSDGTVTLPFANNVTGAILAPANTVTKIFNLNGAIGWSSCNNPTDGIPGQAVETSQQFELRRQQSIAGYGTSQNTSIVSHIYKTVSGVEMVNAYDNNSGAPVTINGVTLPAHSFYVAVVGGTDSAVASAIWTKISGGCAFVGNTTVVVHYIDQYGTPYTGQPVTFERPASVPIYFTVNAVNDVSLPSNRTALVQNAIIAQFTGTNGATKEQINSLISAGSYYSPILQTIPAIIINSLFVGNTASPSTSSYQVQLNNYPTISAGNIAINWV